MAVWIRQMTDTDYDIANKLLDLQDADAEFVYAFNNRMDIYSVWNGDELSGAAQLGEGTRAYINLFIHEPYRRNGIGDRALILCEQLLSDAGADRITTNYRIDQPASKSFAEKHGYMRKFSSTCMEYAGCQFDIPALSIREYRDDDFESAHDMYERAFHEMRVRVGDFPDSVIAQPNDSTREYWASTKTERFVYLQDTEIIGFAHVEGNEIDSISVKSQYQGQGIGRMFMKFIINNILAEGHETVLLYCVVGNWAKGLYDSLGFVDKCTLNYAVKLNKEAKSMSDNIIVERMTAEDTSVYAADLEVFDDAAWALETFNEFIHDPYAYFFKACLGDELAGYCSAYHNTMNTLRYCKIMDLRVKPAFRRRGVAKALMLEVLALAQALELDRLKLEVETSNGAIKLYETLGFQIADTEKGFYDDGADAYIMWRYESKSGQSPQAAKC